MPSNPVPLGDPSQRIQHAYRTDSFEIAATETVERLTKHLSSVTQREGSVLNWNHPQENFTAASVSIANSSRRVASWDDPKQFAELLGQQIEQFLAHGQNLMHPRYVGHQVPAPIPIASFFDWIGSATNQPMAIYEMGPWATAAELAVVQELGTRIGWRTGEFAGVATHGGSLANLTALLTARNVTFGDSWTNGIGATDPVLVVNGDVHYCVARSAGVLGIGTRNVIKVPVDEKRRMVPGELDRVLSELTDQHRRIMAVSACACATPTGAFDPLDEIADVCDRHQVWLHVDAAHGGSFLMSHRHRDLLSGIERADSVVWDAHKMMFMPALCAFVLFKNAEHRYRAFQQDAPYLFDPTAENLTEYDLGHQTLECTKRAAALPLFSVWSLYGPELFEDLVDRSMEQTQYLAQLLGDAEDFELLHEPQCNIVAFQHLPSEVAQMTQDEIGHFQLRLRRSVIESGEYYLVQNQLGGRGVLRTTLMNPLTSAADLEGLLECLRRHARKILGS